MEALWDRLREESAAALDLPADIVAGLPRMELIGDRQFWMEGHRGILSYGSDAIHISAGRMTVCVRGEGLELRSMNAETLCISGRLSALELG